MAIRSKSIKKKVYKFVHHEDEYIMTTIKGIRYISDDGFIELDENGQLKINGSCCNGFAWDGCTPKWEILDLIIGTPDGRLDYLTEKPITYYASMIHDAIYQKKKEIPLSRKSSDQIFYEILKDTGFTWAWLYYHISRLAGWYLGRWKSHEKIKDIRIIESSRIMKANKASQV